MSLSIGNRSTGIIPRGALAQAKPAANSAESFSFATEVSSDQPQLQHGRARDLAGFMPPASWQVLSNAAEHPVRPQAQQINGSYGFVNEANHKYRAPKVHQAA
ncbi:MAG: hypothetical protein HQL43_10455 [Alphaproteobacteria bacterium]|nr:hypothetical protein [Alphaproteobacteria bacterium]